MQTAAADPDRTISNASLLEATGPGAAFTILTESALLHARALDRPLREHTEVLAAGVEAIVEDWPASVRAGIGLIDAVCRQADVDAAAALWPLLLRLRAGY